MNELIREAVELADGFDLTENQLTFPSGHYFIVESDNDIRDWMKDSIAAQLVRHVDALERVWIEWWYDGGCSMFKGNLVTPITGSYKDDRTLNTIRAIVESGVLK